MAAPDSGLAVHRSNATLLLAAACHLVFVILAAAHVRPYPTGGPFAILEAYGTWSGSNNNFGFFAPAVASQIRPQIAVRIHGRWIPFSLPVHSTESQLRLHTLYSFFSVEEGQDLLARSWAAAAFRRYEQADAVSVKMQTYELPTRAKYLGGARPAWIEFYRATFLRRW